MKTRKDTILKFIAIPFIMMAFTIILLSNNVKAANDTTVALKQDGQNVKVSLNPKEEASIASFQIGLKIEASKAADIKNVTFNWANIGNAKLKKESYDKEKGILNLYVVTEAEQNTGTTIDVGTIKIETNKSTKVTVSPIADKTTASSIAHKDTKVDAAASNKITYTANTSGGSTGDNQGGNNSENQGSSNSGNQGGNNSGSGNTGNGSTGSGNNSNGSNSGSNVDNKDDEDNDKEHKDDEDDEDDEENDDENNVEDNNEIDNDTSSNQVDNVATGALPQTGEKDNFIVVWIFMALVVLIGVLLAFGYKNMNKKNSFKL